MIAHTSLPKQSFTEYKELGFNYYIEKPLSVKELQKLIFNKLKLK